MRGWFFNFVTPIPNRRATMYELPSHPPIQRAMVSLKCMIVEKFVGNARQKEREDRLEKKSTHANRISPNVSSILVIVLLVVTSNQQLARFSNGEGYLANNKIQIYIIEKRRAPRQLEEKEKVPLPTIQHGASCTQS